MTSRIPLTLCCLAGLLLSAFNASNAAAQAHFWLTASNSDTSAVAPVAGSNLEFDRVLGTATDIYIWAKPEPDEILENFSLNLISTSDTVLQFDNVQVVNDTSQFQFLFDTDHGLNLLDQGICPPSDEPEFDFDDLPEHALWGIRGFTIDEADGSGVTAASESGVLLAEVQVTGLALGAAELFLQIGDAGINQIGETTDELSVLFGDPADAVLNAKTARCISSGTADATINVVEPLLGDFDFSGLLDATDIDLLSQEVVAGTNNVAYDLTSDGFANQDDRVFWVETLQGSLFGDANFDGTVGFADFLVISTNFGGPGGWATGDYSGNSAIDFADFLIVSNSFGNTTATLHVVPEPSHGLLLGLGLLMHLAYFRRSSSFAKSRR